MANLLGTLNSAVSGMSASQTAIQTTSHNISNINTPGYTRQRVEQKASRPYSNIAFNSSMGPGQLGTGTQITDITRIRNTFYDYQFRSESHSYGDISIKYDYYKNMETIFDEPSDNSISSSLNNFFKGWNELSKDPNSTGAKNVAIENAKFLANNINKTYEKLNSLQENLSKNRDTIISEIDEKISAIKELNKSINLIQASGKSPNDLLDERDRLMDDLSFKIDINSDAVKNVLNNIGKSEEQQQKELDDLKVEIENNSLSGELGATATMDEEITKYKDKLQQLASTIKDTVNSTYKGEDGTKLDIFEINDDRLLIVNPEIEKDVSKIEITAEIALKLYNLKDEKIDINGEKITINNFYNNTIQTLGQASQTVIRQEANESKLLSSIDASRSSVSGVSLDEEMVGLVQLQHAYSANAKVISTIDSLLDVVINGLVR